MTDQQNSSSVNWKIFYDDGTTLTNLESSPENVKAWGVEVIAVRDKKIGRTIQFKKDYYIWEEGEWWGADYVGFLDYLQRPGWKKVIFGRTVNSDKFKEIWHRATYEDKDLPQKTALLPREKC